MKFLEKYELLEQVTSGAVGTFIARDITSGERLLVHIFSGFDHKPDQPPLQWALQSFRSLAPSPLGNVVEGGRYLQAPGAYLITKFPDPNNLPGWIRLYNSQSEQTQESVIPPEAAARSQANEANPALKPPRSEQPAAGTMGEFSRAFSGVSQSKPANRASAIIPPATPASTQAAPSQWSRRVAGPFTKEFLAAFEDEAGTKKPIAGTSSLPQEVPPASSFTAQFLMPRAEPEKPKPSPRPEPPLRTSSFGTGARLGEVALGVTPDDQPEPAGLPAKPAEGEFTRYFMGPFQGAVPAEAPAVPDRTPARPDDRSEFRKLFGTSAGPMPTAKHTPQEPIEQPAVPSAREDGRADRNFDHLFDTLTEKPRSLPQERQQTAWTPPMPSQSSEPPVQPHAGLGARDLSPLDRSGMDSPLDTHSAPGATRVFRSSVEPAPLAPLPAAEGPSDFTRIISRRSAPEPPAPEPAAAAGSPAAHSGMAVPFPPLPASPHLAVPQAPSMQISAAGAHVNVPHAQLQMPPAPSAPKIPEVSQPSSSFSYWPLVIALNVLLLAAITLVLYFALKK